ncbi:MAG: hypothetical protein ACLVFU_03165 [Eggerthellaceae bacterium]
MKKRIAILSALLLMTGCTGNVTSPVSQPSQSSQTSQTSQSEQSGTAPKESTPESSAQAEATVEPPSTEPVNTAEPPETMPTGELPGNGTAESLPVKAQYLEDVPELGEHDTFSQTDGTEVSESAVKVVFSAESTVSDFRLLSIAMQDIDENGIFTFSAEELYSQPELTPERPLEAGLVFWESPEQWISFTDADGNVKYFSVDMSGMDGSLILWEITVI